MNVLVKEKTTFVVGVNLLYKSDGFFYCNDSYDSNRTRWQNIEFFKTKSRIDYSKFNKSDGYTNNIKFDKIVSDNSKFIFDSTTNMLKIKRLCNRNLP